MGGVGRILRTEVQIPAASGQFVFSPWKRWRPSRARWWSSAAEAKLFGSAVAGPVADGQQGLVLKTPQRSLWRSAPASTSEVGLIRGLFPLASALRLPAQKVVHHTAALQGGFLLGTTTFFFPSPPLGETSMTPSPRFPDPLGMLFRVPGKPCRAKLASS